MLQLWKLLCSIDFKDAPNWTVVRDVQPKKHDESIDVAVLGMIIDVIDLHRLKHDEGSEVIDESSICTSFSELQL